jgi:hypothetical protein
MTTLHRYIVRHPGPLNAGVLRLCVDEYRTLRGAPPNSLVVHPTNLAAALSAAAAAGLDLLPITTNLGCSSIELWLQENQ